MQMGLYCRDCVNTRLHARLVLSVFLLLSSSQLRWCVEARALLIVELAEIEGKEGGGGMAMEGSKMIGSRPPRCAGRCTTCGGHCEAVQVPVAPQKMKVGRGSTKMFARDDYSSNYKPIDWKCKCGDFILNP